MKKKLNDLEAYRRDKLEIKRYQGNMWDNVQYADRIVSDWLYGKGEFSPYDKT